MKARRCPADASQRLVEDPLSEGLLRGEFKEAKHIHISMKDKHLFFEPMETSGGDKKEVGAGEGTGKKS